MLEPSLTYKEKKKAGIYKDYTSNSRSSSADKLDYDPEIYGNEGALFDPAHRLSHNYAKLLHQVAHYHRHYKLGFRGHGGRLNFHELAKLIDEQIRIGHIRSPQS